MLKSVYGFDPDVFKNGMPIKIVDRHEPILRGVIISLEGKDDFSRVNLSGNYLVKCCYVTELILTRVSGEEISIPLKHVNGEKPRLTISIYE